MKAPHLVQYQGSKRILAPEILKYFPQKVNRLIEPFSGTCAVSILAAAENRCSHFLINDINEPLIQMMEECVHAPIKLANEYRTIWEGQFQDQQNNVDYFYKVRDEFNNGRKDSARMLFLLARVVKGAVRYNVGGEMNQSCDKRRYGTKPQLVAVHALQISELLKGKTDFYSKDYKEILKMANPGDLVYMDPPYQGTSKNERARDHRYIQGVDFEEFVKELAQLNDRGIDFIVSYDGMTGDKRIGKVLHLLRMGRWRKGSGASFLFRFQNVRSPKHSAFTLWYRPGAAPSSPWLLPAAKGAAWLRPCVIEQNAKGS